MSINLPDPFVGGDLADGLPDDPKLMVKVLNERLASIQRNFEALRSKAVSGAHDLEGATVPEFVLLPWMFSAAPAGYLLVAGQAVTTGMDVPLLREALLDDGSPHGTSGSDPKLPDLRGRALIGAGTGSGLTARALGATVGTETHALTLGQLAAHDHGGSTSGANWSTGNDVHAAGGGVLFKYLGYNGAFIGSDSRKRDDLAHSHTISSAGSGQAHPNMQPSIALNWIVLAA